MPDPASKKRSLPIVGSSTPSAPAGSAEKPRKRLPVLQDEEGDEEAQDRPPWHWSGIGVIAIFLAWLPLASLVNTLVARMLRSADPADGVELAAAAPAGARAVMMGSNALCFALAALAGGYLVGRFGGRAGPKEAGVSGLLTAVVAWALAISQTPSIAPLVWLLLLLVMGSLGWVAAYLGGRLGLRGRRRSL